MMCDCESCGDTGWVECPVCYGQGCTNCEAGMVECIDCEYWDEADDWDEDKGF